MASGPRWIHGEPAGGFLQGHGYSKAKCPLTDIIGHVGRCSARAVFGLSPVPFEEKFWLSWCSLAGPAQLRQAEC